MNRRQTYAGRGMFQNGRNKNKMNPRHSMAMNPRANALRGNMNIGNMRRTSLMMNSMKLSKDPRPLKDKKNQEQQIEKLIEYLCCRGYDSSMLSPSDLSPPSTKNFQYICCFLFQQIDPSFNLLNANNKNKKFEEEVIGFFEKLGYPFKISKSSIRCIAPHAWPPLLGAISWLLELLLFAESFDDEDINPMNEDDEDSDVKMSNVEDDEITANEENEKMDRIFFNLVAENYGLWLKGIEDDTAITQRLMDDTAEKIEFLSENIASFHTANEQLVTEKKRLQDECPKISELQGQRQKMMLALNAMKNVVQQREAYINVMKEKHREIENRVNEKSAKIKASEHKSAQLRKTLSAQTISTQEVQRMRHESVSLHTETDELQLQKEEIKRTQYVLNENINDQIKKIKNLIKIYNDLAAKIEIIPKGAKYSFERDHTLKLKDLSDDKNVVINACTDICNQDIEHIANNLSQIRNHYNNKIVKTQAAIKNETDVITQIESDIQLEQNEVNILNERLSIVVGLFNKERSKMSMVTCETAANVEQSELLMNSQSHDIDQALKNKEKEFRKMNTEYNKKFEECKKIEIQITSKIGIAIMKLLKHRQNIREQLKKAHKKVDEALEKTAFYHIQEPTIANIADYNNNNNNKEDNLEDNDIVMQNH